MTQWRELLQEYGPLVWKTAYRLVNNQDDAADCFQETFLAAWRREQVEPVQSWTALLIRLATIQGIECLRRKLKHRLQPYKAVTDEFIDNRAIPPDEAMHQQELCNNFRKALSEIDHRLATVFCLAYFDELPYEVIAETCSLSVSYVGVLFHRAKAALKARLQDSYHPNQQTLPDSPDLRRSR